MNRTILFIDDEALVLEGFRRCFKGRFEIRTAHGGDEAYGIFASGEPIAVVVTDMRMPGQDGISVLKRIQELSPDTVRMILTGQADLPTAIKAINEGHIFRFMTKPCASADLARYLETALRQYELVTAERALLEKTLNGSTNILTDILSMLHPVVFGEAITVKEAAVRVAEHLEAENIWEIAQAAMLAQIGMTTVPGQVLARYERGDQLNEQEEHLLERVPEIGSMLISQIPRLEGVAKIIRFQQKRMDGGGLPRGAPAAEAPFGSRILKAVHDLVHLEGDGLERPDALAQLRETPAWYDPAVLEAIETVLVGEWLAAKAADRASVGLRADELQPGYLLLSDIVTKDGDLLLAKGKTLTLTMLERIHNYARVGGLKEPIFVEVSAAYARRREAAGLGGVVPAGASTIPDEAAPYQ